MLQYLIDDSGLHRQHIPATAGHEAFRSWTSSVLLRIVNLFTTMFSFIDGEIYCYNVTNVRNYQIKVKSTCRDGDLQRQLVHNQKVTQILYEFQEEERKRKTQVQSQRERQRWKWTTTKRFQIKSILFVKRLHCVVRSMTGLMNKKRVIHVNVENALKNI